MIVYVMDNHEKIEGLLNEIRRIGGVSKVSVISRNGMFVFGDKFQDNDTFSAMSAIIMGAAENIVRDHNDSVYVLLNYGEGALIVTPAGERGILVVKADVDVYEELKPLLKEFENII
jgi:predicted regulator of Ras-like GTPase activity (Roadblock/LC7/MglB family)